MQHSFCKFYPSFLEKGVRSERALKIALAELIKFTEETLLPENGKIDTLSQV